MPYQRGDIVEVPFLIPDKNRLENHPAVIISNDEVYNYDECYICVMLSSTVQRIDQFSFEITNDMLANPNSKVYSQARCHMISYILEKHVIKNSHHNKMKPNAVNRLVEHIRISALLPYS